MENILNAHALDHRLNMPHMITYPIIKSEVDTTRWKTWSLYKQIKIWPKSRRVLAVYDYLSVQVSTVQA